MKWFIQKFRIAQLMLIIGVVFFCAQDTSAQLLTCDIYFIRGDVNNDGIVNDVDIVTLDSHLSDPINNPLLCLDAADVNDDENIDISDSISLAEYINTFNPDEIAPFYNPINGSIDVLSIAKRLGGTDELCNELDDDSDSILDEGCGSSDYTNVVAFPDTFLFDLHSSHEGGVFIGGHTYDDVVFSYLNILNKVDKTGNIEWSTSFDYQPLPDLFRKFMSSNEGNYTLLTEIKDGNDVGTSVVSNITTDGQILDSKELYDDEGEYFGNESRIRAAIRMDNGNWLLGGYNVNFGPAVSAGAFVVLADPNYQMISYDPFPHTTAECTDGLDNDNDGLIDLDDPNCMNDFNTFREDNSAVVQCNDGFDNDGDGLIDLQDSNCTDSSDITERVEPGWRWASEIQEIIKIPNGYAVLGNVHFWTDGECTPSSLPDIFNPDGTWCDDGIDNDGDSLIDDEDILKAHHFMHPAFFITLYNEQGERIKLKLFTPDEPYLELVLGSIILNDDNEIVVAVASPKEIGTKPAPTKMIDVDTPRLKILRLSPTLEVLQEVNIDSDDIKKVKSIIQTKDGGYMVGGTDGRAVVIKLDQDFNVVYKRTVGEMSPKHGAGETVWDIAQPYDSGGFDVLVSEDLYYQWSNRGSENGPCPFDQWCWNLDYDSWLYHIPETFQLISPDPDISLSNSIVPFEWKGSSNPEARYSLKAGTSVGSADLYDSGEITESSIDVTGLDLNGELVFVELAVIHDGGSIIENYEFQRIANVSPVIEPIGNKQGVSREFLEFTVRATDTDGDQLSFTHPLPGELPTGATFEIITDQLGLIEARFRWEPQDAQSGETSINFAVSDTYYNVEETSNIYIFDFDDLVRISSPSTSEPLMSSKVEVEFSASASPDAQFKLVIENPSDGTVYFETPDDQLMQLGESGGQSAIFLPDNTIPIDGNPVKMSLVTVFTENIPPYIKREYPVEYLYQTEVPVFPYEPIELALPLPSQGALRDPVSLEFTRPELNGDEVINFNVIIEDYATGNVIHDIFEESGQYMGQSMWGGQTGLSYPDSDDIITGNPVKITIVSIQLPYSDLDGIYHDETSVEVEYVFRTCSSNNFEDCDGDGVVDPADNCVEVPNGINEAPNNQRDTDGDGFGNACDCDIHANDQHCGKWDGVLMYICSIAHANPGSYPQYETNVVCTDHADMDGDGDVDGDDGIMYQAVAPRPGPSGVSTNQPPIADIQYSVSGQTVYFNGSASMDPDGSLGWPVFAWQGKNAPVTHIWNFGGICTNPGNLKGFMVSPTCTYSQSGIYDVKLTVWDNVGTKSDTVSIQVTVP